MSTNFKWFKMRAVEAQGSCATFVADLFFFFFFFQAPPVSPASLPVSHVEQLTRTLPPFCSPSLDPAEGYAAFQEDSSADEAESPSKMKRSKGIHVFKKPSFSKKKEKDFKVKEKGPKEAKDKKSKDLTAADVVKQWKEKKKKKKPATGTAPAVDVETLPAEMPAFRPIFGAPLAEAVKRTALYDGIRLPAIFRECVDYIENYGMRCEGIYRVSGMLNTRRMAIRMLDFIYPCKTGQPGRSERINKSNTS